MDDSEKCGYNRYGTAHANATLATAISPLVCPPQFGKDVKPNDIYNKGVVQTKDGHPLSARIWFASDAQIAAFDVSRETDFRGLVRMRPSPIAPCSH